MKKYKAIAWGNRIEWVEIDRETESSVWEARTRHNKISSREVYCDTFKEAQESLLGYQQQEINRAMIIVKQCKDRIGNIKGMKDPGGEK